MLTIASIYSRAEAAENETRAVLPVRDGAKGMETEKRTSVPGLLVTFGVVVVMLTPLVVYVALRAQDEGPGMRAFPSEAARTEAAPAQPGKHAIPLVEDDRPPARAVKKPSPAAPAPAPRLAAAPATRFPVASDVPVGMERVKLIETFGRPNMVTTGVSEGRAVETFHYLKPDSGTETVVVLRSGRVIDATSSAY
jgi:hypothetical protein